MHRATAVRVLLITLGVASCTRERTGPVVLVPATLTASGGSGQAGAPGSTLAQPFVAGVTTASGEPVGGVQVDWQVRAGGGFLSNAQSTTDDQGHAMVRLTLGAIAGASVDTVVATVQSLPHAAVTFVASVTSKGTISGTITLGAGFLAPPVTLRTASSPPAASPPPPPPPRSTRRTS